MNNRKIDHIDIILRKDVQFRELMTGFDNFRFIHNALPEIDFQDIDMSTVFLGKKLSYPIIINPLTGGTELSKSINQNLARLASEFNIGMSLGSQRPAIEEKSHEDSYQVRDVLKKGLLIANIGAVQLNYGFEVKELQRCIDMVKADALSLHLNPLMEVIQPEGNTNFKDLLPKIKKVCSSVSKPVIIKEVGHGISGEVAKKLAQVGISAIDVAGSGGTSWAAVEGFRRKTQLGEKFREWGIPSSESIIDVRKSVSIPIIGSGGIYNGINAAKAIVLGADVVALATPLLKPALYSYEELREFMKNFINELQISMFCVGADSIERLKTKKLKFFNC